MYNTLTDEQVRILNSLIQIDEFNYHYFGRH